MLTFSVKTPTVRKLRSFVKKMLGKIKSESDKEIKETAHKAHTEVQKARSEGVCAFCFGMQCPPSPDLIPLRTTCGNGDLLFLACALSSEEGGRVEGSSGQACCLRKAS